MTANNLGQRQRGDLGGKLHTPHQPVHVVISAGADVACSLAGQHLLWMMTNLLARQADEVADLTFSLPPNVMALNSVSPLLPRDQLLHLALQRGAAGINPALGAPSSPPTLRLQVGPGPAAEGATACTLHVSATSWRGYIGTEAVPWTTSDGNPVGPYVAACLAAAEVFKIARSVHADAGSTPTGLWYDAWHMTGGDHIGTGPDLPHETAGVPAVLAGVGAVGSALLHTLFAIPGLTADLIAVDHDPEGIDLTNLNRYTLFAQADLAQPKASRAAQKLDGTSVHVTPRDLLWQQWTLQHPDEARELVLSCVDNNAARHAIQDAMLGVILSASTHDLRAQLIAFERRPDDACLRCRNPVEALSSDASVIAALRDVHPVQRATLAAERGVHPEDLEQFLQDPQAHCGLISGDTLHRFSTTTATAHWSVGFVSTMAGVLLAAAYLRRTLQPQDPGLSDHANMARFQFWHPASPVNTVCHWPPAADCLCQTAAYQAAVSTYWYERMPASGN